MNLTPWCERDIENAFHESLGAELETVAEFLVQGYLSKQIQKRRPGADRPGETIAAQTHVERDIQSVVNGSAEVLDAHGAVLDIGADTVGFAIDGAAADA